MSIFSSHVLITFQLLSMEYFNLAGENQHLCTLSCPFHEIERKIIYSI